jgi:DeoR/GlpR family transcriptional regulator of sugar metabolism
MWIEERFRRIRDLLHRFGHVTVERITADLDVSRETIRRDLVELEALGEIRRVHGGAILAEREAPMDVRAVTGVKEKRAIAKAATALIKSGQTLFLDAGTTTAALAESLSSLSGLHVVTNSVAVAASLSAGTGDRSSANQVHLIGGHFNGTIGATYGSSAVSEIQRYQADIALLSPVGVDAEHGASNFVSEEAELARAMSLNARRTIILADYSKIGVRSRVTYCTPERVALLITNQRAARLACAPQMNKAFKKIEYV